jgi:hypothetical protein
MTSDLMGKANTKRSGEVNHERTYINLIGISICIIVSKSGKHFEFKIESKQD